MRIDVKPIVKVTITEAGALTDRELAQLTTAVEKLAQRCLRRDGNFARMARTLNLAVAALYK